MEANGRQNRDTRQVVAETGYDKTPRLRSRRRMRRRDKKRRRRRREKGEVEEEEGEATKEERRIGIITLRKIMPPKKTSLDTRLDEI